MKTLWDRPPDDSVSQLGSGAASVSLPYVIINYYNTTTVYISRFYKDVFFTRPSPEYRKLSPKGCVPASYTRVTLKFEDPESTWYRVEVFG